MADDNDKSPLTRRRVLGGMATIGAAGALGAGSWAAFSDESQTLDATLEAGELDGSTTFTGSYNDNDISNSLTNVEVSGEGEGVEVTLSDIKPGDYGSVTLDISLQGNPAWVASCLDITNEDGKLDNKIQTIPFYSPSNTNSFFDIDGPDSDWNGSMGKYSNGTSEAFWNSREGANDFDQLRPLTLKQAARQSAAETINWNNPNQSPPADTEVDDGCILLSGDLAKDDTDHDPQDAVPLYGGGGTTSDSVTTGIFRTQSEMRYRTTA
ncbi:hypothetical protein [Halococcus qingdaonensis]|uniref:hypothetical protein n=1 Tax=Halococcus qingdaonensis TaxID=224402 RepID=UPI0021170626|nr:hypothetical protein [Halococcus qingdaonensis]